MNFMKKALAIFLATVMTLGIMSVSVFAEDEAEANVISLIGINVDEPVPGETATLSYESDSLDYNLDYYAWVDAETNEGIYHMYWDYETGEWVEDVTEVPFTEGVTYNLCITLSASEGYVFSEDPEIAVNGLISIDGVSSATVVENTGDTISFICEFACESENADDGDVTAPNLSFDNILTVLKSVLLTIVRFFGALLGIK